MRDENVRKLFALLFAAGRPLTTEELGRALGLPEEALYDDLERLRQMLAGGGVELVSADAGHALAVARDLEDFVAETLGLEGERLSPALLEVLALVATYQPVDRHRLAELRGVRVERALRALEAEGLIERAGYGEGPGRPVLWRTTPEFLMRFGLQSLEEWRSLVEQARAAGQGAKAAEREWPSGNEVREGAPRPGDSVPRGPRP